MDLMSALPHPSLPNPKSKQHTGSILQFQSSSLKKQSSSSSMNWAEESSSCSGNGGTTPPGTRVVHLQGPRPSPLTINKQSHKIGKSKPPLPLPARPSKKVPQTEDNRQPVVIYAVSPKPIFIEASDFKSVVQRLTGRTSSTPTGPEPISPAARLAAMDKASPTQRDRERLGLITQLETMMDWDAGMPDLGQMPGILSPAPDNLPALPPAMFSPLLEFGDNTLTNPFMATFLFPSPTSAASAFFPGALNFSPTPSPAFDFSNIFDSF